MRLFFQRRQKKTLRGFYRFRLWARFDLAHEEQELVRKYRVEDTILSEGDPPRDLKRAAWRAGPIALLVALLVYGYSPFSLGGVVIWGVTPAVLAGLVSFVVLAWLIYHQIREEIRVRDILTGRVFTCRSVLRLVEKEELLIVMAAKFRYFLETMKTWDTEEMVLIEPPPKPGLRLDLPQRAAA